MFEYIKDHWRGNHSLARSYWINWIVLGLLIGFASIWIGERLGQQQAKSAILNSILIVLVVLIIWIWQLVGLWRSSNNHIYKTGRTFWPSIAKLIVIIGALSGGSTFITTISDLSNSLTALRDPKMTDYKIERLGDTDLILSGAINSNSVSEVIFALKDLDIEIFRVNSGGGLVQPAIKLAHYIEDNEFMVMAEGQCISACIYLLAASPYPSIYPDTQVTFHRTEPLTEYKTPEIQAEFEKNSELADQALADFGIPNWALKTAQRQQLWTPSLNQLIEMELVKFVYSPEQQGFVSAVEYCENKPNSCS